MSLRLSFRLKTILGIASIEVVLLVLLVWSSLGYLQNSNQEALVARARTTAAMFATMARDAVVSTDLATLETFADDMMTNPGVLYVRISGFGQVLSQRGDPSLLARTFHADHYVEGVDDGSFDVKADIEAYGEVFGTLELGFSTADIQTLIRDARQQFVIIAGLEILLVALFSWLLGSYLTRSLSNLTRAAQEIRDGGPGVQVDVRGRDELAETAQAFNAMSRELQTSYQALTSAVDTARLAEREADEASQAKSRFLAHMSHELRTPLNAVIGSLDLLLDAELSDQSKTYASTALDAGRALLYVINDVLDFSKIEAGAVELHSAPFDLCDLVQGVDEILESGADAKGIELVTEIDTGELGGPCWVVGDAGRLRQVLINLTGNAIKFTQAGEVRVSAVVRPLDADRRIDIEVADTGIGMDPAQIDRLFDEFTQVEEQSSTRVATGTGLGLAISQRLVNMMGGRITAESEPGKGSRFRFQLRLPRHDAPIAAPAGHPITLRKPGEAHLLLAEDNTVNQMVAVAMLGKAGYNVDVVGNGREALEAVQTKRYDLVLMDMRMPEMDGLAATRAIRALDSDAAGVPIVAMTANAVQEDLDECLLAGMQGYITKPVEREVLIARVREFCGRQPHVGSAPVAARRAVDG